MASKAVWDFCNLDEAFLYNLQSPSKPQCHCSTPWFYHCTSFLFQWLLTATPDKKSKQNFFTLSVVISPDFMICFLFDSVSYIEMRGRSLFCSLKNATIFWLLLMLTSIFTNRTWRHGKITEYSSIIYMCGIKDKLIMSALYSVEILITCAPSRINLSCLLRYTLQIYCE